MLKRSIVFFKISKPLASDESGEKATNIKEEDFYIKAKGYLN